MTAADHANTVRDALDDYHGYVASDPTEPDKAAYAALDALVAQAEAAERTDPVDGLTEQERDHRRDNALNYGEIERLRKVLQAAQAASDSWQLYKAQMEAEGAEYDTAPGSAPVLMDELAQALAALATDRTEAQPWGPDHPSYDEMGQ